MYPNWHATLTAHILKKIWRFHDFIHPPTTWTGQLYLRLILNFRPVSFARCRVPAGCLLSWCFSPWTPGGTGSHYLGRNLISAFVARTDSNVFVIHYFSYLSLKMDTSRQGCLHFLDRPADNVPLRAIQVCKWRSACPETWSWNSILVSCCYHPLSYWWIDYV